MQLYLIFQAPQSFTLTFSHIPLGSFFFPNRFQSSSSLGAFSECSLTHQSSISYMSYTPIFLSQLLPLPLTQLACRNSLYFGRLYGKACDSSATQEAQGWYICLLWLLSQISTNLVAYNNTDLSFYGSGVQKSKISLMWLKWREDSVSLLFPASRVYSSFMPHAGITETSASVITYPVWFQPSASLLWGPLWLHWAHPDNPKQSHISRSLLVTPIKSLLPSKVIQSQVPRIWTQTDLFRVVIQPATVGEGIEFCTNPTLYWYFQAITLQQVSNKLFLKRAR